MSKYLDSDGLLYLWSKVKMLLGGKLDRAGGAMTGALTLASAPGDPLHAATKKYVDDAVAGAGKGDMLKGTYDTDGDGVVDNAAKLGGQLPSYYAKTGELPGPAGAAAAGLMSAADFAKLAAFGPAETYALKSDMTAMYRYRGSKTSYAALPTAGREVGDVWNVEDTGMNYAWTGETWDALGETFSIQSITNAEIDALAV